MSGQRVLGGPQLRFEAILASPSLPGSRAKGKLQENVIREKPGVRLGQTEFITNQI